MERGKERGRDEVRALRGGEEVERGKRGNNTPREERGRAREGKRNRRGY